MITKHFQTLVFRNPCQHLSIVHEIDEKHIVLSLFLNLSPTTAHSDLVSFLCPHLLIGPLVESWSPICASFTCGPQNIQEAHGPWQRKTVLTNAKKQLDQIQIKSQIIAFMVSSFVKVEIIIVYIT